jgi:hypothetical protein
MVDKLKKILMAFSLFRPPNLNESSGRNYDMNSSGHLSSRKFAMTLIAVSIVAFMYFASITLLFFFPGDPHVSALVSMYKDMIVAIAAIAGTLVGIQGLVDWKYNSRSNTHIGNRDENDFEDDSEYIGEGKEDDYSIKIKKSK